MSVASLAACGEEKTTESSTELATFTPSVEIVKVEGDTLDLSALPVEEYVTLGEYKGLTLNVTPKAEVADETVESTLMDYYYQHGSYYLTAEDFLTEGTVAETDIVLIDYEGKKDGVAFEGGTAADAVLGIGSGSFIDGFESGLVGVKVGETVDLNLKFPENYG
ncbi:MAG: FKBP-type peptidyl-prolyl cis-trans isomerase, partial [Lachnospiraceae bacterium]|nr:FKBP-type peptidyl-prolyl cis-trans isomerase [Lachnospiraceae bacterium]